MKTGRPAYAVKSGLKFFSIYDSDHNLLSTIGKKCPWKDSVLKDLTVKDETQESLSFDNL